MPKTQAGRPAAARQPAPEAIALGVIPVDEPFDACFTTSGTLLVAAGDGGVLEFDPATMARIRVVLPGAPDRSLVAVTEAPDGSMLVLDGRNGHLLHVGRDGAVRQLAEDFRDPWDVAVSSDGTRVAVADTGNDRVVTFSRAPEGTLDGRRVIGSRGTGDGSFRTPAAVAFDPAGRLFVADSDNHRVQRFGREGGFEIAFGTRGAMPGQFERPLSLDLRDGSLLVADHFNHRVQRFEEDGDFLLLWGMHAVVPREAGGRIHYPVSIASDPARGLFAVTEPFERRVQLFRRSTPNEQVPLEPPLSPRDGVSSHFGEGLAVDGTLMAVWEPEASAVVIFDLRQERPAHVTTFGSPGRRQHEIGRITAIAADEPSERVWLIDQGNDRLVEWSLRRDPAEELRFDPFMGRVSRSLDFDALNRALTALDGGTARVAPVALVHAPGELLLLDRERGVIRLDERTLEPRALLRTADMGFPRRPVAMALSPDGTRVALLDGEDPARLAAIIPLSGGGETRIVARPPGMVRPRSIAWIGPETLVVSTADDRLVMLDVDGSIRVERSLHGIEDGQLWNPRGLAAAADGSFFVVDWGNHRIQRFDRDAVWLSRFGVGRAALRPRMPDAVPAIIRPKLGSTRPVRAAPAGARGPFPRVLDGGSASPRLSWTPLDERGTELDAVPLREPFFLRIAIDAADGASEYSIEGDAAMPHHGHGMNLAPVARSIEGSRDRIVGPFLFHMPGAWELYFDLERQGRRVRVQDEIVMEDES